MQAEGSALFRPLAMPPRERIVGGASKIRENKLRPAIGLAGCAKKN
jgi:hypothetical protein